MTVWEAVTADEWELPIAQADTLLELSKKLGISYSCIRTASARHYSGKIKGFKIIKIVIK